jgi:hypothetical protein
VAVEIELKPEEKALLYKAAKKKDLKVTAYSRQGLETDCRR